MYYADATYLGHRQLIVNKSYNICLRHFVFHHDSVRTLYNWSLYYNVVNHIVASLDRTGSGELVALNIQYHRCNF